MKTRSRLSLPLLTLTLLMGCFSYRTPDTPELLARIPDRSPEVRIGAHERAAVRGLLGTPLFSSTAWGFDLFRTGREQTDLGIVCAPLPLPVGRERHRLERYTLVSYDDRGRAGAAASGIVRRPLSSFSHAPSDFPSLYLRAAGLLFYVDPDALEPNLLALPGGRDAFLRRLRPADGCVVVLGCTRSGCADRLSLDGGPPRRLPLRIADAGWSRDDRRATWLQGLGPHDPAGGKLLGTLVAQRLAAGERRLEFSARHLDGTAAFPLACRPGEISYLAIGTTREQGFWRGRLVDWQFERTEEMPESFAGRPLVLLHDGRWHVDAE